MPVSLIFNRPRKVELGAIDAQLDIITLDASLSEEHSSDYEITEHPVEQGVAVTDHKRQTPRRLRITGIVSNTPLTLLNFNGDDKRDVNTWELLKQIQASNALIAVYTTLEQHEDLQIESISVPRDAARGNSLEVTIVLKQVNIIESATVEARKSASKGKRPPKKKLDKQNTTPKQPTSSILSKASAAVFGG